MKNLIRRPQKVDASGRVIHHVRTALFLLTHNIAAPSSALEK